MAPRPQDLRRKSVVVAGWTNDEDLARLAWQDDDPTMRGSALAALARSDRLSIPDLRAGLADGHPAVRRRALALVPARWPDVAGELSVLATLDDADPVVLETACFVAGECAPPEDGTVARLSEIARRHPDALCRESAVAALGSLGDPAGGAAVLAACTDKATVRRRAVLALAAFDGPEFDAALTALADDVDWQVRQAAEELLAIGGPDDE